MSPWVVHLLCGEKRALLMGRDGALPVLHQERTLPSGLWEPGRTTPGREVEANQDFLSWFPELPAELSALGGEAGAEAAHSLPDHQDAHLMGSLPSPLPPKPARSQPPSSCACLRAVGSAATGGNGTQAHFVGAETGNTLGPPNMAARLPGAVSPRNLGSGLAPGTFPEPEDLAPDTFPEPAGQPGPGHIHTVRLTGRLVEGLEVKREA